MSASTVSITANPAATRRRPVVVGEKKSGLDFVGGDGIAAASPAGGGDAKVTGREIGSGKDLSLHLIRGETAVERPRDVVVQAKKALPRQTTTRKKPEKPRWQTVISVFTKNFLLLLILLGLVQMIRRLALNSGGGGPGVPPPPPPDSFDFNFEARIAEMEAFLKTTTKMMQVQVEVVDRKIDSGIVDLTRELGKQIEDNGAQLAMELHKLDGRTGLLEKSLGELSATDWLAKDDFDRFVDDFKKSRGLGGNDVSLDEIRAIARKIVEKEIEKHAADGLARVDYALASGGAMVVKHSEPYIAGKGTSSWFYGTNRNGVHSDAKKMLRPSFGEPGQCFPLKGSSGFVQIKLRTAIVPHSITLEHVAKSVAYDRSSAPKDCRVSGWFRGHDTTDLAVDTEKMFLLTEFTYDLEKSNAQTFGVLESAGLGIVDMIRLDFTSNHGSPSHTCIYRLRVHGHEPNSLAMQS